MGFWAIAGSGFKFLGHYAKFSFFILFIGILVLGVAIDSYNQKSLQPFVDDLGNRFLNPLINLNEGALTIIEQDGAIVKGGNFLETTWLTIKTYWQFFLNLYIIYLMLFVLAWIVGHSPLSDTSSVFINYFWSLVIFFTLQEFYILYQDLEMNLPLIAVKNFFKAITLLIDPAKNFAGNIIEKTKVIENTTQIINESLVENV